MDVKHQVLRYLLCQILQAPIDVFFLCPEWSAEGESKNISFTFISLGQYLLDFKCIHVSLHLAQCYLEIDYR